MTLKRRLRASARRGAVEVVARVKAPDQAVGLAGDTVLLFHHMPDRFLPRMEAVVEMMKELARPATYSEICRAPSAEPRFTVTFDDGNLSQLEAARRLASVGVSACFFVIADALDADEDEAARICRDQLWMAPTPFMDRDDLDELLSMGHEVGSHTAGHVNLAESRPGEIDRQVTESRDRLGPWLGAEPHFAWPFGRAFHFSEQAYDAVADAGYATCASAMRGFGTWQPRVGGPPIVFRQSLNLDDSTAVQRWFVLNGEQHRVESQRSLEYLVPVR